MICPHCNISKWFRDIYVYFSDSVAYEITYIATCDQCRKEIILITWQ